jgi:hypothetical protein
MDLHTHYGNYFRCLFKKAKNEKQNEFFTTIVFAIKQ